MRILAKAGADVNAQNKRGDTPLHEVTLPDVAETLLKLGANVNARNNDGETPIFTNYSDDVVDLFLEHGADVNVRNNKGETVFEASRNKGPQRQKLLEEAAFLARTK